MIKTIGELYFGKVIDALKKWLNMVIPRNTLINKNINYFIFPGNILVTIFHYTNLLYMMRFGLKWEILINQIESLEKLLPFKNHQRLMNFVPYLVAIIITSAVGEWLLLNFFLWYEEGEGSWCGNLKVSNDPPHGYLELKCYQCVTSPKILILLSK